MIADSEKLLSEIEFCSADLDSAGLISGKNITYLTKCLKFHFFFH